jgi:hypothetical protein
MATKKTYTTSKKEPNAYRVVVAEGYDKTRVHGEKMRKGEYQKDTVYFSSVESLVKARPHYARVLVDGNIVRYYLAKRPQKDT